jgi:uncharacterized membrane protein
VRARLRKLVDVMAETFWLIPGFMVIFGVLSAVALIEVDRSGLAPRALIDSAWVYNGDGEGARGLLSALAESMISVAGTVFSITIAALSLAAGQMGPRLLRNFTRDRGNQITLGAFLGTFAYSVMVLRSVQSSFIPHLSLTVAILLALICVGLLVFFVGHMANRINVDTVLELVCEDVRSALLRLTTTAAQPAPPSAELWHGAKPIVDRRRGYLQQLDEAGLADWAAAHKTRIKLLTRPGDYVFPGAPIALICPSVAEAATAIENATALGPQRMSSADLEFAIQQLVEVAVRALSPGINDPFTAMSVLDRLGAVLCDLVNRCLPSGVSLRGSRVVLVVEQTDYAGLTDSMFHLIRQNAAGKAAVLIRLIEVLTVVICCERDPVRMVELKRHVDLTLECAKQSISGSSDLDDVQKRHTAFENMRQSGPEGQREGLTV